MKHRYFYIVLALTVFSYIPPLDAYDDKTTHRELTESAIKPPTSNLNSYLVNFLGIMEGYGKVFKGIDRGGHERNYPVLKWFQEGSTDEDAPTFCRASNHFHNPLFKYPTSSSFDWQGSQMSDSPTVDSACGTAHRYSNLTWATGFIDPWVYNGQRTGQDRSREGLYDAPQEMGWDHGRKYFYDALTSTDPIIREARFAKTFRAVGQVIHLLQDMAVPAHVRNDMQSHLWNNLKPSNWGNAFEKYVVTHSDAKNKIPVKPSYTAPIRLTDFWDTNFYNGIEPEVTRYVGIGLAEYTNANFLSDFTIFNQNPTTVHYFPYPAESSTQKVDIHIKDPFNWGNTLTRKYFLKTGDGDTGYLLAGVGYLDVKVGAFPYETVKTIPPLDNNVHAAYAERLLPRAVGYSAALLDYFFRGTMNVTVNQSDITFNSIKVTATNSTANEAMGSGDVTLVIRYKPLPESGAGVVKTLDFPASTAGYSYKVATLANVDMSTARTLNFDFTGNALPTNYTDMTIQLVFKGKLGNEEGAVAVSAPKAVTGIYTALNLALPAAGVYTKVANNSLAATFNELRINVSNNTAIHLTGGSFELTMRYRTASTDPFQSQQVITEPSGAYTYIVRYPANSGSSTLPMGTSADIVFDLSSAPIPVKSTDVELIVTYKNSANQPVVVGYRDISEPTPVDVFNNTDKVCINRQWYTAGSPEAIAQVDTNPHNGIADELDVYRHTIANIYYKASPATAPVLASSTAYTLDSPAPLTGGSFRRLGFILTDYSFKLSSIESWIDADESDPWVTTSLEEILDGTAVRNQLDENGVQIYPFMYTRRGYKMWSGASVTYVNTLDEDAQCGWDKLN